MVSSVLVVDDEPKIVAVVGDYLRRAGFAVTTAAGEIATPMVVNAAGPWAAEVARWAGVDLPVRPIRRHCFTTEPARKP